MIGKRWRLTNAEKEHQELDAKRFAEQAPVATPRQPRLSLAHWASSLEYGTVRGSQVPVQRSWQGCPSPAACQASGVCALVMRRVRAISEAKYAIERMRDART